MKSALITGITGQDGSYLAELLLEKGYRVIGLVSQKHDIGGRNIKEIKKELLLESGDLLDGESLERIIRKHQPAEVYNLGAISFIPASWKNPELTFNVNALGTARLLQLIKDISPETKFFQATSAKIFGRVTGNQPQNEQTSIRPNSPYAVSKTAAHFLTINFREHFGIFACSAIMYNHESERRGPEFVTRKITQGAAKIKLGQAKKIVLGDLEAQQDWGYAPDYIRAAWLILQQKKADDYVLATGELHRVKDICRLAFGFLKLDWKKYVQSDKSFIRKEKTRAFFGDYSKARKKLGWRPKISFEKMIEKMVKYDYYQLKSLSS